MNKFSKLFLVAALFASAFSLASCASARNENEPATTSTASPNSESRIIAVSENPDQPIKVTVTTTYEPKSIAVKKGEPIKLAFVRKDENNCGGELVFPKLGIRKKLPVGEIVPVELTPQETGEIVFTCGMDMMRGKIIVGD